MPAPSPDIDGYDEHADDESQTRRIIRSDENTIAKLAPERATVAGRGPTEESAVTKLRDTRGMERWEKAEPETLTNIQFPKGSAELDFGAVVIPVSEAPVHIERPRKSGPVLLPPPSMPPRKRNSSGRGVAPSEGVQPSPLRQLQVHRAKRRGRTLAKEDITDTRCQPSQISALPFDKPRPKAPQPKRHAPPKPARVEPQPRPVARPRPVAEAYAPVRPQTWTKPRQQLYPPQPVMREPGLDALSSVSLMPSSDVLSAPASQPAPSSHPPSSARRPSGARPRLLSAEISYAGLRSPMPPSPPQRGMRWPTWVAALACTWLAVVGLVVAFALLLAPARTAAKATTPMAAALPEIRLKAGDALTAALTGKLRVTSSQKGVRATLDGVDRGAIPLTITDLAPGQHFLRLHGHAKLEPIERTLMIDAGRTLHLSDVQLKTIETDTDSDDQDAVAERKEALLQAAKEVEARRAAARLDAHRRAVKRIEAKKEAAKKAASKKKKLAAKLKAAAKKARAAKLAAAKEARSEAKSQDVKATGTLNINSLPQSRAMVDGRPIGNTPIMGMKLPVGAHTVTFVHPKHGRKSVTVRVSEEKAAIAAHRFK